MAVSNARRILIVFGYSNLTDGIVFDHITDTDVPVLCVHRPTADRVWWSSTRGVIPRRINSQLRQTFRGGGAQMLSGPPHPPLGHVAHQTGPNTSRQTSERCQSGHRGGVEEKGGVPVQPPPPPPPPHSRQAASGVEPNAERKKDDQHGSHHRSACH